MAQTELKRVANPPSEPYRPAKQKRHRMTQPKTKSRQKAAKAATSTEATRGEILNGKPVVEARPQGGQTVYTDEIADEICRRLATGETLKQICEEKTMPAVPTVLDWVLENRSGFSEKYARARDLCLEAWSDQVITIADAPARDAAEVNSARLRVDSRKWLLSKLRPERYGDSVKQIHVGSVNAIQATIAISADELREIAAKVADEF